MLDLTSFSAALKTLYSQQRIENIIYKNNPFFQMVAKEAGFEGDSEKHPVLFADPQSISADFGTASSQMASSSSKQVAWFLTRKKQYGLVRIDDETIQASRSNPGAFMSARTREIDGVLSQLGRDLSISLYLDGSGSKGRIGASTVLASTTLQLSEPQDVVNFENGQTLVVNAVKTGSVGTIRAGTLVITGINRSLGTLSFAANLNVSIPTIALNDYIYLQGDYDKKVAGLQAWIPFAGVTATPFFGVDRTADATRLGGLAIDKNGVAIDQGLVEAAMLIGREGGKPDYCFMNPEDYGNLINALGAKVQYVNLTEEKAFKGFSGVKVHGAGYAFTVIADPNCPVKFAYLLQMDTWVLRTLLSAPHIIETDGNMVLRSPSNDAVEVRARYMGNLLCTAPGYNAVVRLRA